MSTGRQRAFDEGDALEKAMQVFWRKGYSGTSLSDLTASMGINKPSLYATFGNKESLFIRSISHYGVAYQKQHFEKLNHQGLSVKDRIQGYLESIAKMVSDKHLPSGCFMAVSTCEARSGCLPDGAVQAIAEGNSASIRTLTNFFSDEQRKGNINQKAKPAVLTDFLLTIQVGLTVMARNRTNRNRLVEVIRYSTKGFFEIALDGVATN